MSTPKYIRVAGQVYRKAESTYIHTTTVEFPPGAFDLPPGEFSDPEDPYSASDSEYAAKLLAVVDSLNAVAVELRMCVDYTRGRELKLAVGQLETIARKIADERIRRFGLQGA